MLTISAAALSFAPAAPLARAPAVNVHMETRGDLEVLAQSLNPVVGFYDPLALSMSNAGTAYDASAGIGYLRHAEIKHGRIAMAAFVGFIVGSNKICFPWALTTSGVQFSDIANAGGPAAQWDALPTASKLQIFGAIFFLELWGESRNALSMGGETHYMRGGKPGYYPPLKAAGLPHEVPFNLFDPFGLSKNASPEKKAKGLLTEINNGRLAMIGIMGFMAEAKVPGSVPALNGLITPYSGEVMAPFAAADSLPFVSDMLQYELPVSQWW